MASYKLISRSRSVAEQVEDVLRERIITGKYPTGERIPSEERLTEELQVSRATVRSALSVIATEGLIIRRQGDGTYASSRRKKREPIKQAWIFSDYLETSGKDRQTEELERMIRLPTAEEADRLGLNPGEKILSVRFVTRIDQKPVIYAEHVYREDSLVTAPIGQQGCLPLTEFIDFHDRYLFGLVQIRFKGVVSDQENIPREVVPPGTLLIKVEATLSEPGGQTFILISEYHLRGEGYLATIAHPVFQ